MKKVFAVGLVLVMLATLMVACGATPEPEKIIETVVVETEVKVVETVEVEKEVGGTLVFSSRLFSPPREQEFFINEIIKPFEDEHGVTVNFQIIDDQTLLDRAEVQQTTDHVTTDIVVAHNSRMPSGSRRVGWRT
jgi:ABC-type glycerol-3-phosphate transport system substrate-binding protein